MELVSLNSVLNINHSKFNCLVGSVFDQEKSDEKIYRSNGFNCGAGDSS